MLRLWLVFLWLSIGTTVLSKLLVEKEFLENFDGELVKSQGEHINKTYREHSSCKHVEEVVDTFRFFSLDEDGSEVEHQLEVSAAVDIVYNIDKIHNFHERWIWAYILIRLRSNSITMQALCRLCFYSLSPFSGHISIALNRRTTL